MTGVGIIGCGAMGREIATAILQGQAGDACLSAVFDQDAVRVEALSSHMPDGILKSTDFDAFTSAPGLGLVVEAASPAASRAYSARVLDAGKDILVMSSGALIEEGVLDNLSRLAQEKGCRILIPSGALGGIDAIRGLKPHLKEVSLTTTKPPRGLSGAPGFREWEGREITAPTTIYEGPATEALKLFPANVNVAATLSLAGIGPTRTRVKVVADPSATLNVHEVVATGDFGSVRFRMELRPHERNPRTSALAVMSAIETLRAACSSGPRIGT